MGEAVGNEVVELQRVRFGSLQLGDLAEGRCAAAAARRDRAALGGFAR